MTDGGRASRGGPSEAGNRATGRPGVGDRERTSLSWVHWLAVALVATTGVVHLSVGRVRGQPALSLAGVGFFAAIAVFLAGYRRRLLFALGIAYVVLQIALWAAFNAGEYTAVGYADKAVQVVLVGVLTYLFWTDA